MNAEKTKTFTPKKEKEADNVMMVNIPCSRHEEERWFEAETRELCDVSNFEAYEIVGILNYTNMIRTELVPAIIPTTILKFEARKTKVYTAEKEKESEVFTQRNLHSTLDTVIEENNLLDIQIVQVKEKQNK